MVSEDAAEEGQEESEMSESNKAARWVRGNRRRDRRRGADRRRAGRLPAPSLFGERMVRERCVANPEILVEASRRAARPAICADARRPPRGARNAVPFELEGRGQARRHAGLFLRLCLRLLPQEQPRHRPAAGRGQGPARRLSRTADPRPGQRRRGARRRSPRRRPASSPPFHDALYRGGHARRPETIAARRRSRRAFPPSRRTIPTQEAELKRNFDARRPARRDRHAVVRRRRPGDQPRGRL